MRVLADDPGSVNYGRSVVDVLRIQKTKKLVFRVKDTFLITKMLTNLTGDCEQSILEYQQSVCEFESEHGPFDYYAAERYMNRGIKGTLIELISFMLAINIQTIETPNKKLLAAVTWKGPFKKIFDLDAAYKWIKPAPPHVLDATLIAIYSAHIHMGLKPFSELRPQNLASIMEKIQAKYYLIHTAELAERKALRAKTKASRR
jgi:hypothetical protein